MKDLLNQILNINCLDGLKLIDDSSIDLVVTSPPYNLAIPYDEYDDSKAIKDYSEFISNVSKELYRVLKSDGRVCINVPCDGKMEETKVDIGYLIRDIFYNVGFNYKDLILWDKNHLSSRNAWGSFGSASCPNILLPFEEIIVFYKGDKNKHKKEGNGIKELIDKDFIEYTNGHWRIDGEKAKDKTKYPCPVPFPQKIPKRLIQLYSYRDDIVLDPFSGNGTTCIVAKKLGRNFIGFELSKEYVTKSIKNLNRLT